jgi:TPR repeat protein
VETPLLNTLRAAAEQGDAKALNTLGFAYWVGDGIPQDLEQAEKWLRQSAEQGNASGQYDLGCFYHSALGSALNSIEVVYWWSEAAERGQTPPRPANPMKYPYQTIYADAFHQLTQDTAIPVV